MKNFSELLDTDLKLTIEINGRISVGDLHAPLCFNVGDHVMVDGIEVLPRYHYLGVNGTLQITVPFYQWLHHASDQGWLLRPR
jgi:hypothetical protein